MGLSDRDYGRTEQTPWDRMQKPRSMTVTLIIINVAIFLLGLIFNDNGSGDSQSFSVAEWFGFSRETLFRPWLWWQFLTYGFIHDMASPWHILFNMLVLYFVGRPVEMRMGQGEFLRFYLVSIIAGGIIGALTNLLIDAPGTASITLGASGGVIAIVVLFACYFPHQELFLMGVLRMQAWVLATLYVGIDLLGAIFTLAGGETKTAFTVHLAGAGFAMAYHFLHWNFRWADVAGFSALPTRMRQRSRRMKLKLHDPDRKLQKEADDADRLLAKIHEQGESSLTASERKLLERYSRRQREKRDD